MSSPNNCARKGVVGKERRYIRLALVAAERAQRHLEKYHELIGGRPELGTGDTEFEQAMEFGSDNVDEAVSMLRMALR